MNIQEVMVVSNISQTINVELLEERITLSTFVYSINFYEIKLASSLNDVEPIKPAQCCCCLCCVDFCSYNIVVAILGIRL